MIEFLIWVYVLSVFGCAFISIKQIYHWWFQGYDITFVELMIHIFHVLCPARNTYLLLSILVHASINLVVIRGRKIK